MILHRSPHDGHAQAGAAAAEAAAVIQTGRYSATFSAVAIPEGATEGPPRIGVFVCHCGSNIAGVVDIPQLMQRIERLPNVALATDFMFTCSAETQPKLIELMQKHELNRVVVAACSPKTHEPLFQDTLRKAGLNRYLFEMANIRNQDSWVHKDWPDKATEKAKDLVRMAVARVALNENGKPQLAASTWPNTGIGRINPDGSEGSCAACHARHTFSASDHILNMQGNSLPDVL